ncbi:MAG: hypothetical protein LBE84_02910 [Planctomycetota bacterium]|jgi:hypothetical protein|nr:hypothetical protein [Planctomycetota bacterium]
MDAIGGFDPRLGVSALIQGREEIGRANLPGAARLLPESLPDRAGALVYGRLTDSALLEGFAPYLRMDLRRRELLSPDVFFETLEQAAGSFEREGEGKDGQPGEGPLAGTARRLREILADRELCEALRKLVLKA